MATEFVSSVKESDTYYDFSCTLCAEKDRNVEATKRCEDCAENMCGDCLTNHNMFKAMRDHTLVGLEDIGQTKQTSRRALHNVKCKSHPGNRIELYCGNHDVVGCATCMNLSHRLCEDMHYIPEAAAGIASTHEPQTVGGSIDTLIKRTRRLKMAREDDLKRITTERNAAVHIINQRIVEIKKLLDELKDKAVAEIDVKFKHHEITVTTDISKTADVISKLENEEKRLAAAKRDSESELFIYVKQGKATQNENEKLVQEVEKSVGNEAIEVSVDDTVLACASALEAFAHENSIISLSFDEKPNVRSYDDSTVCSITGCCLLDNDNLIMTDENNKCIKLFDASYKLLHRCVVQCIPTAACLIRDGEVAIALFDSKAVQFAIVGTKICLTRSFSVVEQCRGMSYANQKLYVSCGGGGGGQGPDQVRVYDIRGTLLQTMKSDKLYIPVGNTTTRNGVCVVANCHRGVIAFDISGNVMWQYQNAKLKHAVGICEAGVDTVLVCCIDNGHIFEVKQAGQSSRIVLSGSNELTEPRSMTYDKRKNKLIITKKGCDHVLVYNVSRK